jgi:NAD-dependent SIR2 family protein deacetylase
MLEELNPSINKDPNVEFTPDGDAEVEGTSSFKVPSCSSCSGIFKPDVVFFGESVPVDRVEAAMASLEEAEALVVAGSSLTVNSGFRFAKLASKANKPIVIVNIGPTRADSYATAKIEANTSVALERLLLD